MLHMFAGLNLTTSLLLFLAVLFALFYETINGFHDTANAVATVIYTRAMQAKLAVTVAGVFNFFGVLFGGLSVAYAIVHILPSNILLNCGSNHSLIMIFSMLLAAIIWNLTTWYLGLPISSSHTLIGAIIGIDLTNFFIHGKSLVNEINLSKINNIFLSLIISPIMGMFLSGMLIFLLRRCWNSKNINSRIHMTPEDREKIDGKNQPPFWIRMALIISSIGVSYSHGANDGQKGIGLIMLVLIGIAPASFVLNMNASEYDIKYTIDSLHQLENYYHKNPEILKKITDPSLKQIGEKKLNIKNIKNFSCKASPVEVIQYAEFIFDNFHNYGPLSIVQRSQMRNLLLCIANKIDKVVNIPNVNIKDKKLLHTLKGRILSTVEYAPLWIIISIALALGIGTMIGWKRVVITIGEKIGKKKGMTYAQGMAAQTTAAISIGIASYTGMPVSTTHILSSSVAGAMLVDGNGLQINTIKNVILAWVLTLPVCVLLSSLLYWIILKFVLFF